MFQKFKLKTSEMKYMKKMKYFGKVVQTQRIKARKRPKISVVPDLSKMANNENINTQNIQTGGRRVIEFKVVSEASLKEQEKTKNKGYN